MRDREEAIIYAFTADEHNVVEDQTSSGLKRYTCWTCHATLVRQPFYSSIQWFRELLRFAYLHPIGRRRR